MAKRRKRQKRAILTVKERRKKMLRSSEWVLLGVLFVAISELVVSYYGLTWRYLPYAFAVWMVIFFRMFYFVMKIAHKAANYLLNSISDL